MSNVYIKNYFGNNIIKAELKEILSDSEILIYRNGSYKVVGKCFETSEEQYNIQIEELFNMSYNSIIDICILNNIDIKDMYEYIGRKII